jgi:hypothetical protein
VSSPIDEYSNCSTSRSSRSSAEIGPEELRGAILQRDAAIALDRRRPHPLIGRAVGMVDDEDRDALHFGGNGKAQDHPAVAVQPRRRASSAIAIAPFEPNTCRMPSKLGLRVDSPLRFGND